MRCQGPRKSIRLFPDAMKNWYWRLTAYIGRRDWNHENGDTSELSPDIRYSLRFGLHWGIMLGLGLGLVAGLCGAVKAASTRFDVIYTWQRFKVYSPRVTLLQQIAVVARLSVLWNRQFTMYQPMVNNPQAAWKHEILSKTETGPKTLNCRKINWPAMGQFVDGRIENRTTYPNQCEIEGNATLWSLSDAVLHTHFEQITSWLICSP